MARQLINRVGEIYNGLEIIEELRGNNVRTRCLKCGAEDTYIKAGLVNGTIKNCRECKKNEKAIKLGDTNGTLRIIAIAPNREYFIVECMDCGTSYRITSTEFERTVYCRKCGKSPMVKDRTGEVINSFKIISDKGGGVVTARCTRCAAIEIHNKGQLVGGRVRCHFCGLKDSQYWEDIIGKCFNGLQAIQETDNSDNGTKYLTVKCLDCGATFGTKKGALLSQVEYCNKCHGKQLKCTCLTCGKPTTYVRCRPTYRCSNCGKEQDTSIQVLSYDTKGYTKYNLEKYKKVGPEAVCSIVGELIILGKSPNYTGYDGMTYFDAMCTTHNKKILITKKEIQEYNHDLCKSKFNMD